MKNLVDQIKEANKAYREGSPILTDTQYDELLVKLKEVDPEHELLKESVIEETPKSRKSKLPIPMFSLDKVKSVRELNEWVESLPIENKKGLEVVITPKFDGISLCTIGNKCWTRGDGEIGETIDKHFAKMGEESPDYHVFGEAIINNKNWKDHFEGKISPYSGSPYKNPRNTVAGIFNRSEPCDELKHVSFMRYGTPFETAIQYGIDSYSSIVSTFLNLQRDNSFFHFAEPYFNITEKVLDDIYKTYSNIYPIDGLVLHIDDLSICQKLGRESNMNPAYSRAIKLPQWSDSTEVEITGYKFKMSKQGYLKGTVQFDPVNLKGTEVKQATFINADFLVHMGLTIGTKITVCKSGDVIPKIIAVEGIKIPFREEFTSDTEYKRSFNKVVNQMEDDRFDDVTSMHDDTTLCPCCSEQIYWNESGTEKVCRNPKCKDKLISRLVHFFKTIGVEDFGEPTIIKLYEKGFTTINKILKITPEEFCQIDGLGDAGFKKLKRQFNKLKSEGVSFARLLYAMDLFYGKIGEKVLQNVFDVVSDHTLDMILAEKRPPLWYGEMSKAEGVSDISLKILADGFNSINFNYDEFPNEIKVAYIRSPKVETTSNKFEGWRVCMSGTRDKTIQEAITSGGGEIVSGVSKKTTHLIVKDKSKTSSKIKKANDLGIEIMDLSDFASLNM